MFVVYKYISPSNKVYIGITSKTLVQRAGYSGERYDKCPAFGRAIKKYGWENFTSELLAQDLTEEEAKRLEKYYIKLYDSTNPEKGYNISAGGDGFLIYDREEIIDLWNQGLGVLEIVNKIGCDKSIVQKTLNDYDIPKGERILRGRDTTEYDKLLQDVLKLWNEGKSVGEIQKILNINDNTATHALDKLQINGKERIKRSAGKYHQRKVYQFDKQGNFLNEYESVAEAERQTNVHHGNIVRVCKGERKSAGGFKWSYDRPLCEKITNEIFLKKY